MTMRNVSLDLETYATGPDAVVLSIGAVHFDQHEVSAERYHAVLTRDMPVQILAGRVTDEGTVKWWSEQSLEARAIFDDTHINQMRVLDALADFGRFIGSRCRVWGFGSDFDNVILGSLYQSMGLNQPWAYRNSRDLRTLRVLAGYPNIDKAGTQHNALDDALYQARLVIECCKRIGVWEVPD